VSLQFIFSNLILSKKGFKSASASNAVTKLSNHSKAKTDMSQIITYIAMEKGMEHKEEQRKTTVPR